MVPSIGSGSGSWASSREVLDSEYPKVLKNGFLVTGAQQLQEIFSLHKYEISFIICIIGFGVKGYSMQNNRVGENSGDIVLISFW